MERPKRPSKARVRLDIEGAERARYFASPHQAVQMYRETAMRLSMRGLRIGPATMRPMAGWESLYDPAVLKPTTTGGVVLHREAKDAGLKHLLPAHVWGQI